MQTNGEWRHYLSDIGVISYDRTNKHKINYFHKDRLGSAITFSDHNGQLVNRRSFDAFGKPRGGFDGSTLTQSKLKENDTQATTNFIANNRRGFTTHEHLDGAEIIHMNGRVYDYNLGRFMSVDPLIQSPTNSQSLNPYSYIMNNPLSGIDPSGYCAVVTQSQLICATAGTENEGDPNSNRDDDCEYSIACGTLSDDDSEVSFRNQDVGEQVAGSEGNGISGTNQSQIVEGLPEWDAREEAYLQMDIAKDQADIESGNLLASNANWFDRDASGKFWGGIQAVGGIGQAMFGAGLCSTAVLCPVGLWVASHGLSNLAEGVGATDGNMVKNFYQDALGEKYGKALYYTVDISSAGFAASSKTLSKEAKNLRQATGNRLNYHSDFVREYTTTLGGGAAINDATVILKGLKDDLDK